MPILEELSTEPLSKSLTPEEHQLLFDHIASQIANDPIAFKKLSRAVTATDFNTIQVRPQPGFVCKTAVVSSRNKQYAIGTVVYINICYAAAIPAPSLATEQEIQKALNAGPGAEYKVPLNMGKERTDQGNLIMDACIHPQAYIRSEKDLDYRLYIIELAMEYVEEITSVNLSREFTMPTIRSKGTIPSRIMRLPKPTLLDSIVNQLKKPVTTAKTWKLEADIKLLDNILTVLIPMPDNKNFTSWTIDITTDKLILSIDGTANTILLPNQVDIKSKLNTACYYKKSNLLVVRLQSIERRQYL
ncbi:pre-RNA processing PIH1/Nop17-domain-containing protein [Helicostylum pulchrum]|nr:pre-RNA processing PIH1/Nop17-domain-containing protein [Helicostylum pulchrum]